MLFSIDAADDEAYRLGIAIMAAEEWTEGYGKDPESHAKLIKAEADMELHLRRFFRDLGTAAAGFVNWHLYDQAVRNVHAANDTLSVEVIVNDNALDATNKDFISIVFEDVVTATLAGATSGEAIYGYQLGQDALYKTTQRYARNQVAQLVGRRIDKDGLIVENPNAKYQVSNTTRDTIRESLRTSISLGEDQASATERMRKAIANPARAELIAQTEAVNSFQGGLLEFGRLSGAVAKQSQTIGAVDKCRIFASMGIVDLDFKYAGRFLCPAYHPRCRCGLRLVYQAELDLIK